MRQFTLTYRPASGYPDFVLRDTGAWPSLVGWFASVAAAQAHVTRAWPGSHVTSGETPC